jgi:signal transduction histidine kinase
MNRPWHVWLLFGLCLAVVFAVMGWITVRAIEADRVRVEAQRQQALSENTRQALSRMEQTLAALVVRETAQPYFWYQAFYPPEQTYTRMFNPVAKGDALVRSPLLTLEAKDVLLHFQIGPDGHWTSPQIPAGNSLDITQSEKIVSDERIEESGRRLARLREAVNASALLAALPQEQTPDANSLNIVYNDVPGTNMVAQSASRVSKQAQQELDVAEQQWRQQRVATQNAAMNRLNLDFLAGRDNVRLGQPLALWMGDALLFARRVTVGSQTYVQGAWLNWDEIHDSLLKGVADLLPHADLVPVTEAASAADDGRTLAQIPARIVPGHLDIQETNGLSAYELSLIGGWVSVLLAGLAAAALLRGTLALSERRAAFVSSVTHELRTPLTTFRMYSEMLADGMVTDEAKRHKYLATLQTESERLTHLVENVLSYARLERNRRGGRPENLPLADLLTRTTERLGPRAAQAGMELVVDQSSPALSATVRADVAAVEQILFNLVDNACKYAQSATDRTILVESACDDRFAMLRVCDHGPGITEAEARRLFRPFTKSARDAAHSAPGVGLGLALSRRLARDMGGDLRIDGRHGCGGACFLLTLPLAQ